MYILIYGRPSLWIVPVAAQVGLLMRSYRESFSPEGGRRGLTQEDPDGAHGVGGQ